MPDLRLGSTVPTAIKLGASNVSKVYQGSTLVWPLGVCTPVLDEPFDNLAAWTINGTWNIVAGRNGTAARSSGSVGSISYAIPSANESDTVTVGFAYSLSNATGTKPICRLASDSGVNSHVFLQVLTTGALQALQTGAAGTLWATSAASVIPINTYVYVELQAKLHDTAGFVKVRVNGVEVINVTGIDTKAGGTKTTFDSIQFLNAGSGVNNTIDDLYLTTGAGCAFQGDHAIPTPTAGLLLQDPCENLTAWTNTGGTIVAAKNANGFSIPSGSSNGIVYNLAAGAQTDTLTVGCWLKLATLNATQNIMEFRSDAGATLHEALRPGSDGSLAIVSLATGDITPRAPAGTLVVGTWYRIEVSVKLHDTVGFGLVRVDGVQVAGGTIKDTKNAGTKTVFDQFVFKSVGAISAWLLDDIYIRNDATFMG